MEVLDFEQLRNPEHTMRDLIKQEEEEIRKKLRERRSQETQQGLTTSRSNRFSRSRVGITDAYVENDYDENEYDENDDFIAGDDEVDEEENNAMGDNDNDDDDDSMDADDQDDDDEEEELEAVGIDKKHKKTKKKAAEKSTSAAVTVAVSTSSSSKIGKRKSAETGETAGSTAAATAMNTLDSEDEMVVRQVAKKPRANAFDSDDE
jgi:hypothetical protein